MSDIILPIDGDIRPLEAKVNRFASKGINLNLRNNLSQPLGRITGQVSEFNKSLEASNARVLAFGASAGAVYAVGRAFQEVIKSTVEVEKQLLDINVVLNASQQSLDRFGKSLFDIARNTANPFSAVSKAATELARQGLGVEETLRRTSDALILSRLSGLDAAKSVETLTAAINSFSKAGLTSTQVINKLANVDAAFAVSSGDLAEAISRVGSTAQDVGVDLDQLIGLVTAAQQTTARGGAVIGNSFKTIFTRLQRSDTLTELEGLGIAVRDLAGETLPAVQILQNLSKTFNTLSSSQKSSVAETVGGVYQINILRAALGDLGKQYGVFNTALNTSKNSTNEAIKRNEELNKSNDALLKQLLTDFKQAGKEIGDIVFAPTIKDTAGFVSKLLEDFRKPEESRSAGSKLATEVLKGFGDFVGGPGIAIATAGLAKIFLNLAKFSAEAFKGFMGVQTGADKLAAAQQRINAILAQNPSLIDAAVAKSSNMLAVEQKILSIITAQNNARVQATQLSTKLAPAVIVAEAVAAKKVKGRAEGFIPNFSNSIDQDQIIENIGAANHKSGYKAGKAYKTNLYDGTGKSIPSIINTAEKRKDFINSEGKRASLVIPPNGFAKGFIPNFSFNRKEMKNYLQKFSKRDQVVVSKVEAEAAEQNGIKVMYDQRSGNSIPFIDKNDREKLTKIFKASEEGKAQNRSNILMAEKGRAGYSTQKRDYGMYGVVYPSFATASTGASAGYAGPKNDRQMYRFKTYPFPGNNFDINKDLYEDVRKSLINLSSNYFKQLTTRPQIVDTNRFKNNIQSNLSRSAVEGSLGQIFEAGIKASISSITTDKNANFDLDSSELGSISKRFKLPYTFGNTTYADLKNSLSEGNLNSMAAKIARSEESVSQPKSKKTTSLSGSRKSFASGFMPNEDALKMAIKREKMAGYNSNQIRVGQDNSLVSNQNPQGLGVYNTKDEPQGLKQGIRRYSLREARVAGRASGFIPNFAKDQGGGNFGGKFFAAALTTSFVTPIINSNLETKLSQEDLSAEQKKSTESIYLLTKSIENASSGSFLGGIFGKGGQAVGGLIGAGVGLSSAQGTISGGSEAKKQKQIEGNISNLQNRSANLQELNAGISPKLEELITEINKKDEADSRKIKELKNIISQSISASKIDVELKNTALSDLESQPDNIVPKLNKSQNINKVEQSIQQRRLTIEQATSKNNQPTGVENLVAGLKKTLGSSSNTDSFKKFENFIMSQYNDRQIQVPSNLKTEGSRQDLGTELISEFAFNLDTEQFNKLSSNLIGASDNAGKFIDTLISARNNLGLATGDLQELKEALKIDPKLDAATLKSFLKSLSGVSKNVASSVGTGFQTTSGGVKRVSNYSGVNDAYNVFEDAENRDDEDLLPFERKAKKEEAQARENVMEREAKKLSPEERKQYENKKTLRKANEIFKLGINPQQLAEMDPKFSKQVDEAIATDVKSKDAKNITDVEEKFGRRLTDEERSIVSPPKILSKVVEETKRQQFEKVSPTVTEDSKTKLAGPTNIGEFTKVINPTQLTEEQKNQNSAIEAQKTAAQENAKEANKKSERVPIPKGQPNDPISIDGKGNAVTNQNEEKKSLLDSPILQTFAGVAAANLLPGALKGVGRGLGKGVKKLFRKKAVVSSPRAPVTNIANNVPTTDIPNSNASTQNYEETIAKIKTTAAKQRKDIPLPTGVDVKIPKPPNDLSSFQRINLKDVPKPPSSKYFPTAMRALEGGKDLLGRGKDLIKPAGAVGSRFLGSAANVGSRFLGSAATGLGEFAGLNAASIGTTLGWGGAMGLGTSIAGAGIAGYEVGNAISNIPVGNGENIGSAAGNAAFGAFPTLFGGPSNKEQERQKKQGEYLQNFNKVQQAKKQQEAEEKSERDASRAASQKRLSDATSKRTEYYESERKNRRDSQIDPLAPSFPAPKSAPLFSTKGLFQETYASQAFPGVEGLTDQATQFSYGNQFFKSQEDLNKYKDKVKRTDDDPIKQAQEAKREKVKEQRQKPPEDINSRSYDQEDRETERRQEQEALEKQKKIEAQQTNQTPQNAQPQTTNISVAPTINLTQATNNDGIKQLIQQSAEEWSQRLMAEINQKLSDKEKGNINPPIGMSGGKPAIA